MIVDKMSEFIGSKRIRINSRVSRLVHSGGRLDRVVLNDDAEVEVSTVVNTLPLSLSAKMLDPPPPPELLAAANAVKYRNLILCVFGLDRPSFSPNASLYFPGAEFPFTRLYEPKNRSRHMAPEGQTAIVLELPCFREDAVWNMSAEGVAPCCMGSVAARKTDWGRRSRMLCYLQIALCLSRARSGIGRACRTPRWPTSRPLRIST